MDILKFFLEVKLLSESPGYASVINRREVDLSAVLCGQSEKEKRGTISTNMEAVPASINHTFSIIGFPFIFVISLLPFANVCSNISRPEFNCLHTSVAASSLYLIMDHVRFYINGWDEILNWFGDNCTEQIGVLGFTYKGPNTGSQTEPVQITINRLF